MFYLYCDWYWRQQAQERINQYWLKDLELATKWYNDIFHKIEWTKHIQNNL